MLFNKDIPNEVKGFALLYRSIAYDVLAIVDLTSYWKAKYLGMSESTVKRYEKLLRQYGLLSGIKLMKYFSTYAKMELSDDNLREFESLLHKYTVYDGPETRLPISKNPLANKLCWFYNKKHYANKNANEKFQEILKTNFNKKERDWEMEDDIYETI